MAKPKKILFVLALIIIIAILFQFLVLIVLFAYIGFDTRTLPSSFDLTLNYALKREVFHELTKDFLESCDEVHFYELDHQPELRKTFSQLGIRNFIRAENDCSEVNFEMKSTGFIWSDQSYSTGYVYAPNGIEKGYCGHLGKHEFVTQKEYDLVDNISTFRHDCPENSNYKFYQQIDKDWYIYFKYEQWP